MKKIRGVAAACRGGSEFLSEVLERPIRLANHRSSKAWCHTCAEAMAERPARGAVQKEKSHHEWSVPRRNGGGIEQK